MSYSLLALDVDLIPESTKNNMPLFWQSKFSIDNKYLLMAGYDDNRKLVHSDDSLLKWIGSEPDPQKVLDDLLSTAIEYTSEEYQILLHDSNSIWYEEAAK